jgi:hypothetical protein
VIATHQATFGNRENITAWQFSHSSPIPVWVAKKFHLCGGENWSAVTSEDEVIEAKPGDWAVAIENGEVRVVIVLTNTEFAKLFRPL